MGLTIAFYFICMEYRFTGGMIVIDGTHDGVIGSGRQSAAETAPWGPGQRTCCILHYVFEGRGYFCRGGQRYALTAGQTFLIRPYEDVEYGPDPDDPWGYVWINFVGDAYVRLLDRIDARDGCLVPPLPPESILPFFSLMPTFEGRPEKQHTADHLGLTILGVYADAFPPPGERSRSTACFTSACLLIRAGYHRPSFGIDTMCAALNVSRTTLHRCFIGSCGVSPGAYLGRYRIARAADLLAHGSSVKTAALSCGFSDQLYFSKAFRSATGVSPSDYRQSLAAADPAQKSDEK